MPRIECFEDVDAWRAARELARQVYTATASRSFARDPALRDQMRRAAVSAMANIAEGFERGSDPEFRRFPAIAKGSVGEVRSQLYVALDAGHITPEEFTRLSDLASETSRLIGGFMKYLTGSMAGRG